MQKMTVEEAARWAHDIAMKLQKETFFAELMRSVFLDPGEWTDWEGKADDDCFGRWAGSRTGHDPRVSLVISAEFGAYYQEDDEWKPHRDHVILEVAILMMPPPGQSFDKTIARAESAWLSGHPRSATLVSPWPFPNIEPKPHAFVALLRDSVDAIDDGAWVVLRSSPFPKAELKSHDDLVERGLEEIKTLIPEFAGAVHEVWGAINGIGQEDQASTILGWCGECAFWMQDEGWEFAGGWDSSVDFKGPEDRLAEVKSTLEEAPGTVHLSAAQVRMAAIPDTRLELALVRVPKKTFDEARAAVRAARSKTKEPAVRGQTELTPAVQRLAEALNIEKDRYETLDSGLKSVVKKLRGLEVHRFPAPLDWIPQDALSALAKREVALELPFLSFTTSPRQ